MAASKITTDRPPVILAFAANDRYAPPTSKSIPSMAETGVAEAQIQARVSGPPMRRRLSTAISSQATVELAKEIQLVRRNLLSRKPWLDGFHVMAIVVSNAGISILVAWLITLLFAVGVPWSLPSSALFGIKTYPNTHAHALAYEHFCLAVAFYHSTIICLAHLLVKAGWLVTKPPSAQYLELDPLPTFGSAAARIVRANGVAMVLSIAASVVFMRLVVHTQFHEMANFHAYVVSILPFWSIFFSDLRNRQNNRTRPAPSNRYESHPPRATTIIPTANATATTLRVHSRHHQSSSHRRHRRRVVLRRKLVQIVSFNVTWAYVYLSMHVRLTEKWQVALFASGSLALKVFMQELIKHFELTEHRDPSAHTIHLSMTIPTVAIDAQIRMAVLRMGMAQSVVASSIFIVFCGVLVRVAKILHLRYVISARADRQTAFMVDRRQRVNSKAVIRETVVVQDEHDRFQEWKQFVLTLHAAEVYADMHGEYISIGVTTALLTCLRDHEMYGMAVFQSKSLQSQGLAACFQLGVAVVFDFISSVVEGIHEVPLYENVAEEGKRMRWFLRLMLAGLTAVNVGILILMELKSHPTAG